MMIRTLSLMLCCCCAVALWAAELPVTGVTLFSSGVGYIQRAGTVTDDAVVQLSFKPEQINDLLKSMVLLDLDGGQIGTVSYGAKDPITKTLGSFAIDLSDNPTYGQLLNRLRGVQVEVNGESVADVGTVLGVETKKIAAGKDQVIDVEVLNLLTDGGFRSIRLDEIMYLQVKDDRLNAELRDALKVLATGLDNQRKPVAIAFNGKGERHVIVGYLAETPIWKTSYRLVLGEKENALQGWAVVENTSDADWTNVRLSLVSGRPISFIEDLYSPLYVRRPVVQPQLYASINPVAYQASVVGGAIFGIDGTAAEAEDDSNEGGNGQWHAVSGKPQPESAPMNQLMSQSVQSAAAARDLGQAFEYAIKDPVILPRQQSALIPIVTGPAGAWKISIYNPAVQAQFPLYGLRLKNATGAHLMGGPITVYDGDVYAGDAVIEDMQPDEQRLISYAIDLGVTADHNEGAGTEEILAITLVKGLLNVQRKFRRTVDYTFAIKDGKDRKIMVEHPINPGWDLVAPKEFDENTGDLYRFILPVSAKDGGKLTVTEERTVKESLRVMEMNAETLVSYQKTGKISPAVRDALQKVIQAQGKLTDLRAQRAQKEQRITKIRAGQNDIRQNMDRLDHASDLYKRYVTMLDQQETEILQLQKDIEGLQQQEDAQRKELNDYVAGLNLE